MAKKKYEVIMVIECEEGEQKYVAQSVCDGLEEPTCVKHIEVKEMKTYSVEYKDRGGYGCGEEVEASSEDQAVKVVQMELIKEGGYMAELSSVDEVIHEESPVWSIKDGPELDQEDQDTLNDALSSLVNDDGVTLEERIKDIENNK